MPTTSNFGWTTPADTDLVKDGALAIRTLGNGIDTSLAQLKGGTTGQVLSKTNGTDMAFTWVTQDDANAIQNTIVDAKGDLITATANDTPARLAVGTNGQFLTADSTAATGLAWAAAPTGKVKQVIFASNSTNNSTSSTTYTDTGLSATITPTSASSKIYIWTSHPGSIKYGGSANISSIFMRLLRGSTEIFLPVIAELYTDTNNVNQGEISFMYEDSPATTSATTYKTQFRAQTGCSAGVSSNGAIKTMILMEVL